MGGGPETDTTTQIDSGPSAGPACGLPPEQRGSLVRRSGQGLPRRPSPPKAGSKLTANFSANHLTMNGARIGDWSGGSSYKGLYHSSQSGSEYMMISNDT